jgi:mannitol/fructose-specific phosphotransferase system IIA component (Ntr-type)/NhaP-type Na+/H+ or K+/H+ antiporter
MVGQLVGGVFVGPYFLRVTGLLGLVHVEGYDRAFDSFHFIIFTFLGVLAFAVGEELHVPRFRRIGKEAAVIAAVQGVLTWVLLTTLFLLVGWKWPLAVVAGSIGVATAPAITFVLLNHHEIEGRFRNMVANVLVLSDVVEVTLFSIFAQVAVRMQAGGEVSPLGVVGHLGKEFGEALLIGFGVFLFLRLSVRRGTLGKVYHADVATLGPGFVSRLLTAHPTPSVEVLVVVIGAVSVGVAIALGHGLPFLITGVFAGLLIANFHTHALFDSLKIDNVMPLLNLVFFALIGANIRFDGFGGRHLWVVLGYVGVRTVGKLAGTHLACRLTKQDPKVRSCLPLLMLPQAGVAAVEAVYLVRLLGSDGQQVADVILPALVIFEMAGVFLSERTLLRWRDWTMGEAAVLSREERIIQDASAAVPSGFAGLSEFQPKGFVGGRLDSATLPEAIGALATALERSGCIAQSDAVVERALAREKMGATAIGQGIAIPHSKVLGQAGTVCALGVVEPPLSAAGPDGVPIDTVVLLVSPAQQPDGHLRALATIARILADAESLATLKDAIRDGRGSELFG